MYAVHVIVAHNLFHAVDDQLAYLRFGRIIVELTIVGQYISPLGSVAGFVPFSGRIIFGKL